MAEGDAIKMSDGLPIDDAPADDPRGDSPSEDDDGSTDAPTAPFVTIIRIINEDSAPRTINRYPSFACAIGLSIAGSNAPLDQATSIEGWDTLCDCSTCRPNAAQSPICTVVDLQCDLLPPILIPAGGFYEYPWDGRVWIWHSVGQDCTRSCSTSYAVPTGDYRLTLAEFAGTASAARESTAAIHLPAGGGIVELRLTTALPP